MQSTKEFRQKVRTGEWDSQTSGVEYDIVQTNVVILPKEYAFDFLLFCQRNPKSCPIIEVLNPGQFEPINSAPEADIRTDIPRYNIYKDGKFIEEVFSIEQYWTEDLVTFLLGCSFTFEHALLNSGINLRHIDQNNNVAMYKTNISTETSGKFHGPLVVSMRPIKKDRIIDSVVITSKLERAHGAPLHIGNPEEIGIKDITNPDYGEFVDIADDEEPVFWACGVTPQAVALDSKPSLMITHSPGHMFVTDLVSEDIK